MSLLTHLADVSECPASFLELCGASKLFVLVMFASGIRVSAELSSPFSSLGREFLADTCIFFSCLCVFSKSFQYTLRRGVFSEHLEKDKTIHVDLISILLCLPSTKISVFLIFEVLKLFTFQFYWIYNTEKCSFRLNLF